MLPKRIRTRPPKLINLVICFRSLLFCWTKIKTNFPATQVSFFFLISLTFTVPKTRSNSQLASGKLFLERYVKLISPFSTLIQLLYFFSGCSSKKLISHSSKFVSQEGLIKRQVHNSLKTFPGYLYTTTPSKSKIIYLLTHTYPSNHETPLIMRITCSIAFICRHKGLFHHQWKSLAERYQS